MKGETLYAATDYYRPFPDPRDVFSNRVEEHSLYLLPVATLSLKHLQPDWVGDIHFILPIEPVQGWGVLGEKSTRYRNNLCCANWVGYTMRNNKCEFAGDFRYFHKAYYAAHPPEDDLEKQEMAELAALYANTPKRFASCAEHFREQGWLCADPKSWNPSDKSPPDWMRRALVRDLGGVSFDANWSNLGDSNIALSRYPDQYEDRGTRHDCDRVLPQTEDGRDFHYIGEMEMWNYIDSSGVLLLFYDPEKEIALTTIDWT